MDVTVGRIPINEGAIAGLDARATARLRQVLVARFGWDLGIDAWQDAMTFAWEHVDSVGRMENPIGYLYRVGQSSVRRQQRWRRRVEMPAVPPSRLPDVEPRLPSALAKLSPQQRLAVLLVHAHGWTPTEAAEVLGVDISTVRNHLNRGMHKLRTTLGVDDAKPR